jgi:diguanylate cyclase (GGDEF)-like protein
VAALPLHDIGDRDLVALRLRSWDAQRHLSEFVCALLEGVSLEAGLEALTRSLAASMEGVGAAVHHGFDGESFAGVVGSWPDASGLPLAGEPWAGAFTATSVLEVAAAHRAVRLIGAVTGWLVPVLPKNAVAPAVLSIWRDRPDSPSIGHRRAFAHAVEYVELALVRSAEHERLLHLARHDSLTGVGNRTMFRDHLAAALARGEANLAVGFCDLDDFKHVNDRFGHGVGDDLLVAVAARLRATLRAGDEIARIGGDEFTILWREIPDAGAAEAIVERVVAAGLEPFPLPEGEMTVGISIGYVLAQPGATADSLLEAADAALYQSKQAGGRRATRSTGA